MTDKPIPEPVRLALKVLEGYLADPVKHARLKSFLPALAMRLSRAGIEVDLASLTAHVEKGFDHLEALAKSLDGPRQAEPALGYEAVRAALPARAADPDDDEDETLPAAMARAIEERRGADIRRMVLDRPELAQADDHRIFRLAAAAGDEALVRWLLRRTPAAPKSRRHEAIRAAAKGGHLEIVRLLARVAPQGVESADYEALRGAAGGGHDAVVEFLAQIDIEGVRAHEYDAIQQAAGGGHASTVALLTKLNWRGPRVKEFAAFRRAAGNGHLALAGALLERFPEALRAKDYGGFRTAAAKGHLDVVAAFAPLVPERDRHHLYEAFHSAVNNGHEAVARHLAALDPACVKHRGGRALGTAAHNGNAALVRFILSIDPALIAANGHAALREAAGGGHFDLVKELDALDPAGVAARDHAALQAAATNDHPEILDHLIARAPEGCRANRFEAVLRSAEYGYTDIVARLTAGFADADWQACGLALQANSWRMKQLRDRPGMVLLRALGLPAEFAPPSTEAPLARMRDWQRAGLSREQAFHLRGLDPVQVAPAAIPPLAAMLRQEGYGADSAHDYAYRLAKLFRSEQATLRYLQKWGRAGRAPLHDLAQAIVLPETVKTDLDWKSWGDAVQANGPKMARLVRFAHRLRTPLTGADGRWHMALTRDAVARFGYRNGRQNPALAAFCLEHDIGDEQFAKALDLLKSYAPPESDNIPAAAIPGEAFGKPGYVFRKLDRGDLRGLFLGELTDCCQSIGNAGGGCATHGFTSPNGGFYIVEKIETKEVVAQCWAWRGTGGELVLDSLEALGDSASMRTAQWDRLMSAFASSLKGGDVSALMVGQGGRTPDDAGWGDAAAAQPIDYKGYRDSGRQFLLWRNPAAAASVAAPKRK